MALETPGTDLSAAQNTLDGTSHQFAGGADAQSYAASDTAGTPYNAPTVTGDFSVTDPDNGEAEGGANAPTYAITSGTGENAATAALSNGTYTISKGTGDDAVIWGRIILDTTTGAWTFTPYPEALNSLTDGESEMLTLTAEVTAKDGTTDSETFTITLTGANDTPDIEVGHGRPASVLVHGVEFAFKAVGMPDNIWKVDFTQTAATSTVSLDTVSGNVSGASTIVFVFKSDKTAVTAQDIIDLWGNTASQTLKDTISLTLRNAAETGTPVYLQELSTVFGDAAVFTGGVDPATAYTVDDLTTSGDTPTVSGDFSVTDADAGEAEEGGARAPTYAILDGTGNDAATVSTPSGTAPDLTYTITKDSATWGTIALNTETGAWTFTANAAALDALTAGQTETLALRGQVEDHVGGASGTNAEGFTITLNGADEAASTNTDTDTGRGNRR